MNHDAIKIDKDAKIVSKYNDLDIISDKMLFSTTSLFSFYLFYNKLIDNFMTKWHVCFYPTYFFFVWNVIKFFIKIVNQEKEENEIHYILYVQVKNLENILIASNFFSLILYSEAIMVVYYFCEFMDSKSDEYLFYSVYLVMTMFITHILYSLIRLLDIFKLESHSTNDDKSFTAALGSSLIAPVLTYFSNMMIVCNASAGTCTQIYMSTITSIFGAFGVTISDFSDYLFPVTVVLLLISLFSLYINKRKIFHPPFLLGVFATTIIVLSHFVESLWILLYIGNVLMIIAAIWNAKLNKFYGLPSFK